MEPVIKEYLGQIKVGRKQSYRNLALFPLLSKYRAALDYVNLDEAFAENLVEVAETGRECSVPEIKAMRPGRAAPRGCSALRQGRGTGLDSPHESCAKPKPKRIRSRRGLENSGLL